MPEPTNTQMMRAQNYCAEDVLRDRRKVLIRAIRSTDKPILQEGFHHLSDQSKYFRFFMSKKELSRQELAYFTDIDYTHHVGLLASVVVNDSEIPAGVCRYIMNDAGGNQSAEVAVTVTEEYQGLGIGTVLLKHLIRIGKGRGIKEFTAFVLPENRRMLRIFCNSRLPLRRVLNAAGVWEISLSLS